MPKKAPERSPLWVKRCRTPGLHAVGGVDGLYLHVKPPVEQDELSSRPGARSWILRVKVGDRRPEMGLGGYPDVTLEQARQRARDARDQIRQGIDPIAARQAAQDALRATQAKRITFDQAAKLCHAVKAAMFRNPKHRAQWINSLTEYASPKIGDLPVADVELPHIIDVLKPIWTSKTETASRVRGRIEDVLDWATVNQYRTGDNPAKWSGNLEHALPRPAKVKAVEHHPALPWADVGAFMAQLRAHRGTGARALEFAILTAARSGEVRLATWDEIDLQNKMWTVPAKRMKAGKEHRVPLSDPAVALLKSLPRHEGNNLLFPGSRKGNPLSDNTLSKLLRDMGVDAVPHGFRSTFKDWARSCTAYPDEVSELALAHVNSDATRAAYARDELLAKRTRLMRDWAKYLANVPKKANVVQLRGRRG
jgi:integrase